MNRLIIFVSLCSTILCATLFAEIIEVENFKEIHKYLHPESLVILDIDDTLLIPVQTLGTDVWFLSRLKYNQEMNDDRVIALDQTLAEWESIRHLTKVKIVEEGTDLIIKEMQNANIAVMGLTTQGLALATRTIVQLQSLSIDLSKTPPSQEDHYFINGKQGVLYRKGILFTSGTSKGDALVKILKLINFSPKYIVFINDKLTHIEDLEKGALSQGISFTGLRYSYSDKRVASYRPEIAEIQWKHSTFDDLISDEEAALLLH